MWGNPLPESCVGLFIALCTEWILGKCIKTHMLAHQSQQSEVTRLGFHLGTQKTRKVVTKTIVYTRYGEILFQKVASDYVLHFVQNGSSKSILNTRLLHINLKNLKITQLGFHLGAPKRRKAMTTSILYKICREILFQKVALGYLSHFVQNGSSHN